MFKKAFRRSMFWLIIFAIIIYFIGKYPDQLADAHKAYRNGDYTEAMKLWELLAEKGNANAQHNLGALYKNGEGVPQSDADALYWFKQAAEGGNAPAQFELGKLIEGGLVPAPGPGQGAVGWIIDSAEQGYPLAMTDLGLRYMIGAGVDKDPEKAAFWLDKLLGDGRTSPVLFSGGAGDIIGILPCG